MKRDVLLFIEDVLESIELIGNFLNGITEEEFRINPIRQDAVVRRIEVIEEAVKNVPEDFRKKYPKVEWRKIAGTRDVIIHSYFGLNLETIWKVVQDDLPVLKKEIKEILKKEEKVGKKKI